MRESVILRFFNQGFSPAQKVRGLFLIQNLQFHFPKWFCQQEKLDDDSVEIVTKYLSSILTKTSEAITVVESVKGEKSFG